MPSLQEILDLHEQVIIDTSVNLNNKFIDNIYSADNLFCINKDLIAKNLRFETDFLGVLTHPHTRTISGITREIKSYSDILGKKAAFLFEETRYLKKMRSCRPAKKLPKNRFSSSQIKEDSKQEMFRKIQETAFNCYVTSRKKELYVTDYRYEHLVKMISCIEEKLRLKKDSKYAFGFSEIDRSHDSDTDERIVACLLYHSMFSENQLALVTRDYDFVRMLAVIPRMLGSNEFMPCNGLLRKGLLQNTFSLYTSKYSSKNNADYEQYLSERYYLQFEPEFRISTISRKENNEVKKYLAKLWTRFPILRD